MDGLASSIAEQSNPPSAEELWVGGTTGRLVKPDNGYGSVAMGW